MFFSPILPIACSSEHANGFAATAGAAARLLSECHLAGDFETGLRTIPHQLFNIRLYLPNRIA